MSETYIILLIEDNPADAQLVFELIRDAKKPSRTVPEFRLETTDSLKAGLNRLSVDEIDLVLLDLGLPDSRGLDTFLKAFDQNPKVPYVIISGYDDEELAIQAVREGAQDYLVKAELNGSLLIRTMLYAIERKQAREKIREQYEFLEDVLESITHPFYILDVADYSILRANSVTDFGSDEIGGKCYALTHRREEPCNDPERPCPLKEVLRTKKSVVTEHIHHDDDGNTRYTEVHGFPLFDVDGNVVQMIEYSLDITERKEAEEALRASEGKYRSLVESTDDVVYLISRDMRYKFANGKYLSRLDLSLAELVGQEYGKLHPWDTSEEFVKKVDQVIKSGKPMTYEYLSHRDNRYFIRTLSPVIDEELGEIKAATVTSKDITERKQLEQKVVEISEREQTRIGQDLHDGLGQLLTGIKYMSEVLEKKLRKKSLEEVADLVDMNKSINEAIIQIKMLAKELYPVTIQSDGFMSALQEYASRITRMYGIDCQFKYDHPVTVTEHSTATHLFRIIQEAVNNAIHHGRADQIIIQLLAHDGRTTLCVKNNGVDIAENIDSTKGIGIHSMTYRAKMIGASLAIQSDESKGTVLTCSWEDSQVKELPE